MNFFQPTINYLIKTYVFIKKYKVYYFYYLILFSLTSISSILIDNSFNVYGIIPLLLFIFLYFFCGYFFILPLLIYKTIHREKIEIPQITKTILSNTKMLVKLSFSLLFILVPFFITLYLFFDMFLHIKVFEQAFANTARNHGFGFYPIKATFFAISQFIFAPIYFFQMVYLYEKNNFWFSFKRSIKLFIKHTFFLLPILVLQATYYFTMYLFVPDGNYYFLLIRGVIESYLEIFIIIAVFLFYKDHYKIYPKLENSVATSEEVKKQNIFVRWLLVVLLILLVELDLFLGYGVILTFYLDQSNINTLSYIYTAVAAVSPFLIFLLKLHRRFFKLSLIGAIIILIGIISIGTLVSIQTEKNKKDTLHKTKLTSSELLKEVNNKRKENKLPPLLYEQTTCIIAKIRVKDVVDKGTDVFNSSASYKRAIDKAFKENPSLNWKEAPDWYNAYLTYQETAEDAINVWNEGEAKALFDDRKLKFGCVAIKDEYGVLVVGYYNLPTEENYYEDLNLPLDYEDKNATFL